MSLKIHILFLLGALLVAPKVFSADKFLRIRGEVFDEVSKKPLETFLIRIVEDDMDSTTQEVEGSEFSIWIRPNHVSKVYFIKPGYTTDFILIDASFIPSRAYKNKQRLDDVEMKLNPSRPADLRSEKPDYIAEYVAMENAFSIQETKYNQRKEVNEAYEAPFPSPADTYSSVKPTDNQLSLTKEYNEKLAKGNSGFSRVLQGVLFADMNYCFFNERTNEANAYLEKLKRADGESWNAIKAFDSPEYGRIICRTINREQSRDTLFALGAQLETSRLILQDFTSDSKVLVHLKTLKKVLEAFTPSIEDGKLQEFMSGMYLLIPHITQLEDDYKKNLRNQTNFEMQKDTAFIAVLNQIKATYLAVLN